MDLTKLSDDDLMALKGGDLTKMSDAGLMSLKGAPARTGNAGLDVAGGLLRGAGSIGATLLAPFDMAARALNKGKPVNVGGYDIVGQDRRAGMDAALDSVGVDRNSLSFGAGKLGAEVAGTLGVGGGLANVAGRAIPALANAPMMTALRTSGMTTGLNPLTAGQKAADMGARMVAGGVTGGVTIGEPMPESVCGVAQATSTPAISTAIRVFTARV